MKTFLRITLAAAFAVAVNAQVGTEPGITRQQADQILQELKQIRQLLEKQGATAKAAPAEDQPTKAKIADLTGVSMLGSKTAPLTIVEFTDYQCPFCQRFHLASFPEIKKNYIDTGKVRFYSKDLPLDFHTNAMRAAQAARCGAEQGKFWELRNIMATNPDKLDLQNILNFADGLKLDSQRLRTCVESGKYKDAVQTDVLEAMKLGASGTPAFIIGKSVDNGVDGELMVGALPYTNFDDKLKQFVK